MGVPRVNRNSARAKVTHATTGAAATRRQDWQWQTMLLAGEMVAEYRTAPHMQPPWMSCFTCFTPQDAAKLTIRFLLEIPKKRAPPRAGLLVARKRGSCSAALVCGSR